MILALILAQSLNGNMNLNVEPMVCLQNGSYVRADRRRAFELNCGTNMTCTQSGGRITIASSGGAGGSGAPIDGGYLTLTAGSTGSHNEVVLSAGTNINITAGGVVSVTGSVANATLAASATALAANPTDCSANQFATTIAANGNLTCAQPAFTDISGTATTSQIPTVPVTKGGTNLTTVAANQVLVGTAADTFTAKTVPSCSNGTTDKLLFDNATQTWSCGTDQGGGSGLTSAEVSFYVLQGAF